MHASTYICKCLNHPHSVLVFQRLFKRHVSEDIGADLNQGYDTFIEKIGNGFSVFTLYFVRTIGSCARCRSLRY